MATLAVFSSKGGVGKTSLAVNLAWAAASISKRKTLLWDLDAQAAASVILARDRKSGSTARSLIERDVAPDKLIVSTDFAGLDLLPADASLRTLDLLFDEIGARKRLRRIAEQLERAYDLIVIDCPPGLGLTAEQIIRGVSLILLPSIPSALSIRAADELTAHLAGRAKRAPPVLPVFNMVDRRRTAHLKALADAPGRVAIPVASAIEQMADRGAPVGVFGPDMPVAKAIAGLWMEIERRLDALSAAEGRPVSGPAPTVDRLNDGNARSGKVPRIPRSASSRAKDRGDRPA